MVSSSWTVFSSYNFGSTSSNAGVKPNPLSGPPSSSSEVEKTPATTAAYNVDFKEKTISAAGAAFLSAIIVNPLDVAKTRLQAQAAGVQYQMGGFPEKAMYNGKCPPKCPRGGPAESVLCPPDCFRYKSTFDVFNKVIRQEGFLRLWRGTDAALAIAVPTVGIYLPCYDVLRDWMERLSARNSLHLEAYTPFVAGTMARSLACVVCGPIELARTRMQAFKEGAAPSGIWATLSRAVSASSGSPLRRVRVLWTGVGSQLARDVPFSAICWTTLEPIRRILLKEFGADNATGIMAANVGAGAIAGSIAAGATCPLDVVKTRRQIVKDPSKPIDTSTSQVLQRVWREAGLKGLFAGVVPRVGRAGPSVAIVVSFYEVMKYFIHQASHEKRQ